MTLTARLKRRFGYDTTITKTAEYARYKYTVTHLNGETTTQVANGREWKESSLRLLEPDNDTWAAATTQMRDLACKPGFTGSRGFDIVRELEGVQEVEKEQVGWTVFEFLIDWADHSIVDMERREE